MASTDTRIADQAAAIRSESAEHLPANVLAALTSEEAELDAAGLPAGTPPVGSAMPDGDLLDLNGEPTTLDAVRRGKPAVIVFYRGAWCPYCNLTLRTYQAALVSELDSRGTDLIAISPQRPDGSLSMQQKNALTYAVLSDPGNQIAGRLRILTAPTEDAREAQAGLGLDISASNADGTYDIPMPTVVILDAAGTIRWIDVHPNYTTRSEPGQILDALDATLRERAPTSTTWPLQPQASSLRARDAA
jgi:peroxiredoxin